IDHVALGPAGLFAVHSADWGTPEGLSKSEIVGDGLARDETPVNDLVRSARKVAKNLCVRFTGYLVVVPDTDVDEPVNTISRGKAAGASLVTRSILPGVLRGTVGVAAGHDAVAMADVFEVRTRLQEGLELR